MRLIFVLSFLTVLACGKAAPETLSECQLLDGPEEVDSCIAEIAVSALKANPEASQEIVDAITDSAVRDYVLLAFQREIDPGSTLWCRQIHGGQLRSRCRTFQARPHLHRELVGGAPGRPPPGTAGPGGDRKRGPNPPEASDHGRPPPPPSERR